MRRPWLWRMVRPTLMLVGEPVVANPARRGLYARISFRLSFTSVGQFEILEEEIEHLLARQHEAEVVFRISSRDRTRAGRRRPGRIWGYGRPERTALFPGRTCWRRPLFVASWNLGSSVPSLRHRDGVFGIDVGNLAGADLIADAALQLLRARRRKRWRLPRLLSLGLSRRSMKIGMERFRPPGPQPALFTRMYQSTSRRTCRSV